MRKNIEKEKRAFSIVRYMTESTVNLIVFHDEPEVWFQYYLGLYLEKPTFITMLKKDHKCAKKLRHPLVKGIVETKTFDEKSAELATSLIKTFLNQL